jgi:hypothetical protein
MAFAIAAFIAVVLILVVTTEASAVPPCDAVNLIAISPGLRREPDTIAARESRILCLVASMTSDGKLASLDATIYCANLPLIV